MRHWRKTFQLHSEPHLGVTCMAYFISFYILKLVILFTEYRLYRAKYSVLGKRDQV